MQTTRSQATVHAAAAVAHVLLGNHVNSLGRRSVDNAGTTMIDRILATVPLSQHHCFTHLDARPATPTAGVAETGANPSFDQHVTLRGARGDVIAVGDGGGEGREGHGQDNQGGGGA